MGDGLKREHRVREVVAVGAGCVACAEHVPEDEERELPVGVAELVLLVVPEVEVDDAAPDDVCEYVLQIRGGRTVDARPSTWPRPGTTKPPVCRRFRDGSDGTRTRDLRRDRPAF